MRDERRGGLDRRARPPSGGADRRTADDAPPRLRDQPLRVVLAVLAVDAAAAWAVLDLGRSQPVHRADLVTFALLALGALVHLESARHIERFRDVAAGHRPFVDLKSMWSFAALLLLPLGPALGVVVVTFVLWWLRVARRPVLHRWVFSASAVILASCAARAVLDAFAVDVPRGVGGPVALLAVCLAAVVRWAVNLALVVLVISVALPRSPWRARTGSAADAVLALGALALGVVLAVVAVTAPWLVPVLLLPVATVHRGFLFQQLDRTASTDGKTGLATITRWRSRAAAQIARAARRRHRVGILMIDIDDFKAVNDRHGHVVGDRVLRAVAGVLVEELADGTVGAGGDVGRFGGEEFVAVVRGEEAVGVAAERVRDRIGDLRVPLPLPRTDTDRSADRSADGADVTGLSVSIGVALFPDAASDLDDLVLAADDALYAAKRAGRNRVHHAPRLAIADSAWS